LNFFVIFDYFLNLELIFGAIQEFAVQPLGNFVAQSPSAALLRYRKLPTSNPRTGSQLLF